MKSRYKVIISSKNVYKEVELLPETSKVKVGTNIECDVRLRKDLFFGGFELQFVKHEKDWAVLCSDNLYLTVGDIRKLVTKNLKHGDMLEVRYQDSDMEVFNLFFTLDFEYENKKYDVEIDISEKEQLVIGGTPNADIYISDENIGKDRLLLKNKGGIVSIIDDNSKYGVCVNGSRILKQKDIRDFDFFSIANFSFYFKNGKLYTDGNDKIRLKGLTWRLLEKQLSHLAHNQKIVGATPTFATTGCTH